MPESPIKWKPIDQTLLAAALASTYKDVQSTKRFLDRGHEERNPLLGKKPKKSDVDKMGLLGALVGTGAASLVSEEYRTPLLAAWAAMEATLAHQNEQIKHGDKPKKFKGVMEGPLTAAVAGGLLGLLLDKGNTGLGLRVGPDETALTYTKKF